jgi:hypothetical protein
MDLGQLSGTERAIFGDLGGDEVAELLDRYLRRHLGTGLSGVLFRSGRIDVVWAVQAEDGRAMVIKVHRQPLDLAERRAATRAQRLLAGAGFPCPEPLSGPDRVNGLFLSVETLLAVGRACSGREAGIRRSIAAGLAEHIEILRREPELVSSAGRGPAWCRYQGGPWPTPHDPIFDFRTTPPGFAWLDEFARAAAGRLVDAGQGECAVVGHADWYAGNLRFDGDRIVAALDWDLVADNEAMVVGMSAGSYTASSTSSAGLPRPDEVAAFLMDYDGFRSHPFSGSQQETAAAAAGWAIAFNARCELSLLTGVPAPGSALDLAAGQHDSYLELRW